MENIVVEKKLAIGWELSAVTGWGVYGLNMVLELLKKGDIEPILLSEPAGLYNGESNSMLIAKTIENSRLFRDKLLSRKDGINNIPYPILHSVFNNLQRSPVTEGLSGTSNIGVVFFEDARITDDDIKRAKEYDILIAGSTWNADILKEYGFSNVFMVHQGIDTSIFYPAPNVGMFKDRFVIFSGGKLEFRKGQDIIVAAFREFNKIHRDSLLVTCWNNMWPTTLIGLDNVGHVQSLPMMNSSRKLLIKEWLIENGISEDACIDAGYIPNFQLPMLLREASVALFTNRCEGGTNLVAMECMALGLPVILSANTGHLDLLLSNGCTPLLDQGPVLQKSNYSSTNGWGESSIDEILYVLESCYTNYTLFKEKAKNASRFMMEWSWENQISKFLSTINNYI